MLQAYFRNHADTTANVHLSGLDLCPDMLKVAETKKCYDALKPVRSPCIRPYSIIVRIRLHSPVFGSYTCQDDSIFSPVDLVLSILLY